MPEQEKVTAEGLTALVDMCWDAANASKTGPMVVGTIEKQIPGTLGPTKFEDKVINTWCWKTYEILLNNLIPKNMTQGMTYKFQNPPKEFPGQ